MLSATTSVGSVARCELVEHHVGHHRIGDPAAVARGIARKLAFGDEAVETDRLVGVLAVPEAARVAVDGDGAVAVLLELAAPGPGCGRAPASRTGIARSGNACIGMPVSTSNSVRMVPPPNVGTFMSPPCPLAIAARTLGSGVGQCVHALHDAGIEQRLAEDDDDVGLHRRARPLVGCGPAPRPQELAHARRRPRSGSSACSCCACRPGWTSARHAGSPAAPRTATGAACPCCTSCSRAAAKRPSCRAGRIDASARTACVARKARNAGLSSRHSADHDGHPRQQRPGRAARDARRTARAGRSTSGRCW